MLAKEGGGSSSVLLGVLQSAACEHGGRDGGKLTCPDAYVAERMGVGCPGKLTCSDGCAAVSMEGGVVASSPALMGVLLTKWEEGCWKAYLS